MSRKLMPTISILLLIAMLVLVGTNGATIAARAEGERLLSVRKRKRSVRVYPRLIVGIVRKFRVIFPLEIPEIAFAKTVDDELLCVRV